MPVAQRAPAPELVDDEWISAGETARTLTLHIDTIYQRCRNGTFPGEVRRVGRAWWIRRSDVEAIAPLVRKFGDLAAADLLDGGGQ